MISVEKPFPMNQSPIEICPGGNVGVEVSFVKRRIVMTKRRMPRVPEWIKSEIKN